jgi:hypothetical protein
MPDDAGKDMKKVSFFLKLSEYDRMTALAHERGEKIVAGVMREAVAEYIERRENPGHLREQMEKTLKENPELFAPVSAAEVQRQLQTELRRALGDRYHS